MRDFLTIFLAIYAVFFYFLPTIIAGARGHHQMAALFCLNLLLGWTLLGWVLSLVWAFMKPPPERIVVQREPPPPANANGQDVGGNEKQSSARGRLARRVHAP